MLSPGDIGCDVEVKVSETETIKEREKACRKDKEKANDNERK